jgi:hypothetical protein
MPKRRYYIPRKDDDFFNFQGNLLDKVVAKKAVWGIPDSAVDPLVARRAEYEPRYHKSQDTNKRTRADVLVHRQIRKTYEKEIRTFINAYIRFNGKMTDVDRITVGMPERDTEPSPRPAISDIPMVFLEPLGGGSIKVTCKRETDQTRPSIHRDADGIECRYIFVPKGEKPPASSKDAPNVQVSKKARFIIECGDENAGERFWGFFRWVNLTNPANSGPWSNARGTVIA